VCVISFLSLTKRNYSSVQITIHAVCPFLTPDIIGDDTQFLILLVLFGETIIKISCYKHIFLTLACDTNPFHFLIKMAFFTQITVVLLNECVFVLVYSVVKRGYFNVYIYSISIFCAINCLPAWGSSIFMSKFGMITI
jgi:hypothetical protein